MRTTIRHRVQKYGKPTRQIVLPKDGWQGQTFREADGTELLSTWNGRDPIPGNGLWPEGRRPAGLAILNLRAGRA